MDKKTLLWGGVIVVALAIVLVLVFTTGGTDEATNPDGDVEGSTTTTSGFVPDLVTAAHQYNSGDQLHIVAGEADVNNGCMQLSQTVDYPENAATATIELLAENPTPDAMCTQAIQSQRFKATFNAPEDVGIEATYNGEPVELNLQPVPEGENLENFETSTKG